MGQYDFGIDLYDAVSNDDCGGATGVDAGDGESNWYYNESNYGATGSTPSDCGYNDTRDVWYSYTPEDNGVLILRTHNYQCGPEHTLSLYDGCNGNELECQSSESLYEEESTAQIVYNVDKDTTYYIRVAINESKMGEFDLELALFPPVTNDQCSDAIAITGLNQWDSGSTYGATGTDTTDCCFDNQKDVWYSYTATSDQTLYFFVEGSGDDGGDGAPMTIALYDSCGGNEIACDCGNSCYMASEVEYNVTQNTKYWIRVAREDNSIDNFVINISDSAECN